ncbi:MipA/OmpV family protein [Algibacillus agarilyticus]|uniref:MipA/OmpV family protein n=1 Tax=Algibacillus agarilyticus TaxID=2234133 RepID=UPI000DD0A594|nr:MipA/OmpV family protein [Algibacillus agarilyticus]
MPDFNRFILFYLGISILSVLMIAQANASQSDSSCTVASYIDDLCVEDGQFELSVALGYGRKQNPYQYRDDIPLVVLADFNFYYGNWFIDNGTVGYSFRDTPHSSFNVIANLADDSAYFHQWHLSNVTTSQSVSTPDETQSPDVGEPVEDDLSPPASGGGFTPPINKGDSIDQPTVTPLMLDIERKIAINMGVEYNRFYEHGAYHIRLTHDVSGVHKGYGLAAEASYPWAFTHLKLISKLGLHYKSDNWLDYYYGINDDETNDPRYVYQAAGGFSAFAEMTAIYPINSNWSLISNFKIERLSQDVVDSPLVNRKSLTKWFTGVSYHF